MAKPWGFHHDNHRVSSVEPYAFLAIAVYRHRQSIFRTKRQQQHLLIIKRLIFHRGRSLNIAYQYIFWEKYAIFRVKSADVNI